MNTIFRQVAGDGPLYAKQPQKVSRVWYVNQVFFLVWIGLGFEGQWHQVRFLFLGRLKAPALSPRHVSSIPGLIGQPIKSPDFFFFCCLHVHEGTYVVCEVPTNPRLLVGWSRDLEKKRTNP